MEPIRKPAINHIGYLDSVRGIAALMVLFYHFIGWHWQTTEVHLLSIVFNGADAVSFFFVLSGFVLSYKYLVLDHSLDIRKFYINRIFRLFPGFMVAVLVMAIYWTYAPGEDNYQNFKNLFIHNKSELYEELFLFRSRQKFYGAGWTLVIELLGSLFIPFAIALAKKDRRLLVGLVICFLLQSKVAVSIFQIHFVLGVILSTMYYDITSDNFKQRKWYKYRYLILAAAFLFYSLRHIERIFPMGEMKLYMFNYFQLDFFLFTGFASFVFLVAIIGSERVQKFLDKGLWRFYGKISYGIYLIHWFTVSFIFDHWAQIHPAFPNQKVAFIVMLIACLATSTLFATIIHYAVELPFIRYGKRVAHKLKPSLIVK